MQQVTIFEQFLILLLYVLIILCVPLRTSSAASLLFENRNLCFSARESDVCFKSIASARKISRKEAKELRRLAEELYANEETPEGVTYGRLDVAVACLALKSTLPGPDDDCSACSPACEAEARPQFCALYCSPDTAKVSEKN